MPRSAGLTASPRTAFGGGWVLALAVIGAACRQDMHDQPRYSPLEASAFFADGRSAREPIEGTVARGLLRDDDLLYRGIQGGEAAMVFPFPVTEDTMVRGQDMFDAFCSPCHGRTGVGDGVVVQRGFTRPPDLTSRQVREMPLGHFFNVITNGIGAMPDHASQIKPADRWAIVAYLRALQLAGSATIDDVPPAERGRLDQPPAAAR